MNDPFSPGSLVQADSINMVTPYRLRERLIVAEAELPLVAGGDGTARAATGLIPVDEISPYADFDPAAVMRSTEFKSLMSKAFLRTCDRRFFILDHSGGHAILSLKSAIIAATRVITERHQPHYEAHGFNQLQNLHHHLLKHPLGLGGNPWGGPYDDWRADVLSRLRKASCPAASTCDGKAAVLDRNACVRCPLAQKLRCFEILAPVRRHYEKEAAECVREASDRTCPRHYHYTDTSSISGERAVLVFMNRRCRKVVAKRRGETHFTTATFFQPDDCDPRAPDEHKKYAAERRRIQPIVGACADVKICIPQTFGYR